MEKAIEVRNKVMGFLYRNIVKHVAFQFDPELMHRFFLAIGRFLGRYKVTKKITRDLFYYKNSRQTQVRLDETA